MLHEASKGQIQWGDVATWIASVGTVAAVFWAIWLATFKARNDRARDQAIRVVAWLDVGLLEDGTTSVRVLIRNSSQLVATDLHAFIKDRDKSGDGVEVLVLGIGPTESPDVHPVPVPLPENGKPVYSLDRFDYSLSDGNKWRVTSAGLQKR